MNIMAESKWSEQKEEHINGNTKSSLSRKRLLKNLQGSPAEITDKPIQKIISDQFAIKLGQFIEGELDIVLKKIKNRKATVLDETSTEVWKTRKFDGILLWLCNEVNKHNTKKKWMRGCILLFHKKGDLGINKNNRGITLTAIAVKVHNVLLFNYIWSKITKIL